MNKKLKLVLAVIVTYTLTVTANYTKHKEAKPQKHSNASITAAFNELEEIKLDENRDMDDFIVTPQVIEPQFTDKPPVKNSAPSTVSRGSVLSKSPTTSKPTPSRPAATPIPKPTPKVSTSTNIASGISQEERILFARLVSAEAAGESFEGKLAVATIVMNRVKSNLFPNTITGVIYGKDGGYYQFSPVLDGRINEAPTSDSIKAVDMVLNGHRSFESKVMWFLNPNKAVSSWIINNKTFYKSIGNHDFYY